MSIVLLPHQSEFLKDYTTKYLALVSGYGAGKTFSFCHKIIDMARRNPNTRGLALEPNSPLLHDILIPDFEEVLKATHTQYTLKKTPNYNYTLHWADGSSTIVMLRSMENWERLIGVNASFIGLDEIDVSKTEIARKAVQKLQGRLRAGNFRQMFFTTTPEGFKFMYDFFVRKSSPEKRMIKAKTQHNIFLPLDFIQSLQANYPPELLKAYLDGEFTNLNSAQVYYNFDRDRNSTKEEIVDDDVLYCGIDFNISNMSAVIGVFVDHKLHILEEISGAFDTPELISILISRYGNSINRKFHVYPDSSSKNRKTSGSDTDYTLLRDAGFTVHINNKNPLVADRILTVNTNFFNARQETQVFINLEKCKELIECLDQQAYNNKTGEPDKQSNFDHLNDALGYLVYGTLPIKIYRRHKHKPVIRDKYTLENKIDGLTA